MNNEQGEKSQQTFRLIHCSKENSTITIYTYFTKESLNYIQIKSNFTKEKKSLYRNLDVSEDRNTSILDIYF